MPDIEMYRAFLLYHDKKSYFCEQTLELFTK